MKRILHSVAGALLAVLLVAGLVVSAWLYVQWTALRAPLNTQTRAIVVPRGETFTHFVDVMAEASLVSQPAFLKLYGRFYPLIRNLKAGEYAIEPSDSTLSILKRIRRGEVVQHSVTIPEGLNSREIAEMMAAAGIADEIEFLRLVTDATFLSSVGIQSTSLEGYLFPDTYHFSRGYGASGVIKAMLARFKQSLPGSFSQLAAAVGLTETQALTLASIIEKETGAAEERKLISAVFHNRLKKKMRLQSDPTVIYGIGPAYDGNIRKRDLLTTTPYNTYRVGGLPPGPIASPGADAISAAVSPAPVSYLYFVSRNDGTHYFSSSLIEHNKAVDLYQKRRSASR